MNQNKPIYSFEELRNHLLKYDVTFTYDGDRFVCGRILNYKFRLFEELLVKLDVKCGWIGIKDENSKGSMWSAFYTPDDIDNWVRKHESK